MPLLINPVTMAIGAGIIGYAAGAFSDTGKMIKVGLLVGGGYYLYKKAN